MSVLNDRQKGLYEYLLNKSTTTSDFVSKEEICRDLNEYYPRNQEKSTEHNSTIYGWLRRDIKAINDQPPGEFKLIVSRPRGYKIANQEEAQEYISRRFKAHYSALKRTNAMARKVGLNGQFRLTEDGEVRTIL